MQEKRVRERVTVSGAKCLAVMFVVSMLGMASVSSASIFGGKAARARGAKVFADHGCAHCHGDNGMGGRRGPSLSDVGSTHKAAAIRTQILNGGGGMPSYKSVLDDKQVSDVVAFLRAHKASK